VGDINYNLQIDPWGTKAITVYREVIKKFFELKIFFASFIVSMIIIFWKNKNVFMFHLLFSIVFFLGLILTYVFWFNEYESSILTSYDRYLSTLFVPAFIFSLYIIILEVQKFIDVEKDSLKHASVVNCMGALLISGAVGGYFYRTSFENGSPTIKIYYEKSRDLYNKIKSVYDVKNKNCLAIWQGGNNIQKYLFGYISYGELKNLDSGSFGLLKDNLWRTVVDKEDEFIDHLRKDFEIIVVVDSNDDWLNRILLATTNYKSDGLSDFAFVKIGENYKLIRSDQ